MKSNKIVAIIILIFIVWAGYQTTQLPKTTMVGEVGPKFFPALILVLMTILCFILLLNRSSDKDSSQEAEYTTSSALVFLGLMLGGIAIIYFFGFIIGMGIGLSAMLYYIGWKVYKAIPFSFIVVSVVYLIFAILLKMPLPQGILL